MAQFKAGDTVEITLFGNVIVGTIIVANELNDAYRVVYKEENEEWFGKNDMKLLDTPKSPKTADEMFAELGYSLQEDNSGGSEFVYRKGNNIIVIDVEDGEYFIENEVNQKTVRFTFEEHKAIHKKLQELGELGWL